MSETWVIPLLISAALFFWVVIADDPMDRHGIPFNRIFRFVVACVLSVAAWAMYAIL